MSEPVTPTKPVVRRRRRGRWVRRLWLPGALAALLVGVGGQWIGGGSGAPTDGGDEPARPGAKADKPLGAGVGEPGPAGPSTTPTSGGGDRTERVAESTSGAAGSGQPSNSSSNGKPPTEASNPVSPPDVSLTGAKIGTGDEGSNSASSGPGPGAAIAASDSGGKAPPIVDPATTAEAPQEPPLTTFEPDRFESLLSLVRSRAAAGEFAAAGRHLAALQAVPLVSPQAAAVNAVALEFRGAVTARVAAILQAATTGSVVTAHQRAAAGLDDASREFATALQMAFVAADLGREPRGPATGTIEEWPSVVPLAAERSVRAYRRGVRLEGTVVEADGPQLTLTLRVAAGGRVRFPTLAMTRCEPVDATAAEAVELGIAALRAGQPLLARLWLHRARAGAERVKSSRRDQLATLLR